MFVCEIHKISKMIIQFVVDRLYYNLDTSVMFLFCCCLRAIWLDALESQGTSSNHWRNPPRGRMLNNQARLIHFINLCCSFCHFSRTWSWLPLPLEKIWSFLLSLCSGCSWGLYRSWSMTFDHSSFFTISFPAQELDLWDSSDNLLIHMYFRYFQPMRNVPTFQEPLQHITRSAIIAYT